jgi:hypothetical protein
MFWGTIVAFILVPLVLVRFGPLAHRAVDYSVVPDEPMLLADVDSSFRVVMTDTASPRNKEAVETRLTVERDVAAPSGRTQVQRLDTTQASERATYRIAGSELQLVGWSVASGPRNEACVLSAPIVLLRSAALRPGQVWEGQATCPGRLDFGGTTLDVTISTTFLGSARVMTAEGEPVVVWNLERTERIVRTDAGGAIVSTTERSTTTSFSPVLGIDVHRHAVTTTSDAAGTGTTVRDVRLVTPRAFPYPTERTDR